MAITYQLIKDVSADLYARALRRIPDDTRLALEQASQIETSEVARKTLHIMLESADAARRKNHFVCSDAGIPVFFMKIGTAARLEGDIKRAFTDGFAQMVADSDPPLLEHVTNPLTLERGYQGKDMPIVTYDLIDGADYVDLTCSPKALGSGRWAALEIFSFPSREVIEEYIMKVILKAGPQHCPPVVVGVGIGGTFDHAAKMAKEAMLRPFKQTNPEPILAAMESRLMEAINATGFGPMGTGGDSTAMAVHINYSAGHGFTPVAVCFNCWINRRTRARIYNDGRIEVIE